MLKFLFHWILIPAIVPTSDWIFFFLCNVTESHVFGRNSPSLATVPTFQASVLELSKIRSGSYVVFDLIEIERVCRRRLLRKSI
jgi:hypothetical protein